MQIQNDISLKAFNTFGIEVSAKHFAKFDTLSELQALNEYRIIKNEKLLVLGGGSNVLFTGDYNGLIIKNELKGIEVVNEDDDFIYLKASAGENWYQLVLYCIQNNFAGLENLTLIPGNVGASPMQNIGAYGVEIKDVFYSLEAFHLQEKTIVTFNNTECNFGYRESVFKRKYKGQFVILNVTFQLRKNPKVNISYGAIQQELEAMGVIDISIAAISQAVARIRQSKLPDPRVIGNAGSFFKNPTISKEAFDLLKNQYPSIVGYPVAEKVKVAAGWLIEDCGWKGYRRGDAGCHNKQALVLVNYGQAQGTDMVKLAVEIMASVKEKFGIKLEPEINIIQ